MRRRDALAYDPGAAYLGGSALTLKDFFERYGPTVAIAAAFFLLMVLLPGNAPNRTSDVAATGGAVETGTVEGGESAVQVPTDGTTVDATGAPVAAGGSSATGSGARTGTGAAPAAGAGGAAAGPEAAAGAGSGAAQSGGGVQLGKGPCRSDARMLGIAKYMPPCLSFSGDNGGETARGVTANTVKVIRFVSQTDPATQAILKGAKLADDPPVVTCALQVRQPALRDLRPRGRLRGVPGVGSRHERRSHAGRRQADR